jgi:UDP-glucose 4-epimerase
MDLIDAHIRALDYLLKDGKTEIFNLGSNQGYSVMEIIEAARISLRRPYFDPAIAPRRAGDPATLIASNKKAGKILGWKPTRALSDIIDDAMAWHLSDQYRDAIREKYNAACSRSIGKKVY